MIPLRKTAETLMALFVTGFGSYTEWLISRGHHPLEWSGVSEHAFAWAFIGVGALHAIGIRLNGARNWSPFLRLIDPDTISSKARTVL